MWPDDFLRVIVLVEDQLTRLLPFRLLLQFEGAGQGFVLDLLPSGIASANVAGAVGYGVGLVIGVDAVRVAAVWDERKILSRFAGLAPAVRAGLLIFELLACAAL